MDRQLLIGLGELLWDVLPGGEQLGGAPANFSYHAAALGAVGLPVSTVGMDERGERALRELEAKGLSTAAITVTDRYPTGYVEATLDDRGVATIPFPTMSPGITWRSTIRPGPPPTTGGGGLFRHPVPAVRRFTAGYR